MLVFSLWEWWFFPLKRLGANSLSLVGSTAADAAWERQRACPQRAKASVPPREKHSQILRQPLRNRPQHILPYVQRGQQRVAQSTARIGERAARILDEEMVRHGEHAHGHARTNATAERGAEALCLGGRNLTIGFSLQNQHTGAHATRCRLGIVVEKKALPAGHLRRGLHRANGACEHSVA